MPVRCRCGFRRLVVQSHAGNGDLTGAPGDAPQHAARPRPVREVLHMARNSFNPDTRPVLPPEAGRPHSKAWRGLEAEGIRWEGQVLIVGGAHDLAARLILTRERLALVANGDIALDIPC